MPCKGKSGPKPIDLKALAEQLVTQLASGVLRVSTPQLGEVEYLRPTDVYQALSLLRQEAARASGALTAGVFTVGYDRCLGPVRGGCL